MGVVKITLTDWKVATAAAVSMKGGGEQVIGREAATAALLPMLACAARVNAAVRLLV